MTDVNIDDFFPALEDQAARLNEASANANKTLAAIEKRIVALNIGFEVWLDEPIAIGAPAGSAGPFDISTTPIKALGIARIGGKWVLAVKPMKFVDGFYEGDTGSPYRNQYTDGEEIPVLSASRELRIAALQALPKFLHKLSQEMMAKTNGIERIIGHITHGKPTS